MIYLSIKQQWNHFVNAQSEQELYFLPQMTTPAKTKQTRNQHESEMRYSFI